MLKKYLIEISLSGLIVLIFAGAGSVFAQGDKDKSIGGKEHGNDIYGVEIGMDVPTALKAVFVTANRKPGQEKPDALRKEGKDKQDIRVVYKELEKGELQIVFTKGKIVSQIILRYKNPPITDDLRLPFSATIGSSTSTIFSTSATQSGVESPAIIDGTTSIEEFGARKSGKVDKFSAKKVGNIDREQGELLDGARFDDRYTIGFTDNQRLQRIWWRDEETPYGYKIRIAFIGKKLTEAGAKFVPTVVQKTISIVPEDEKKFIKAMFQ